MRCRLASSGNSSLSLRRRPAGVRGPAPKRRRRTRYCRIVALHQLPCRGTDGEASVIVPPRAAKLSVEIRSLLYETPYSSIRGPTEFVICAFFTSMDRPANSDFLRCHCKMRSSLHRDSPHCKLKLSDSVLNDQNCKELEVRAGTMTRICTGNFWNSYEFQVNLGTRYCTVLEYYRLQYSSLERSS